MWPCPWRALWAPNREGLENLRGGGLCTWCADALSPGAGDSPTGSQKGKLRRPQGCRPPGAGLLPEHAHSPTLQASWRLSAAKGTTQAPWEVSSLPAGASPVGPQTLLPGGMQSGVDRHPVSLVPELSSITHNLLLFYSLPLFPPSSPPHPCTFTSTLRVPWNKALHRLSFLVLNLSLIGIRIF